MKKALGGLVLLITIISLLAVPATAAEKTQPAEEESLKLPQHIFVISVDGLNYEGFVSSLTTNMDHMASEGVIDKKAYAFKVNSVEAAEASLLTGTFPEEHKFITRGDKVAVESVLDVMRKQGKKVMVVDGSGGRLEALINVPQSYIKLESRASDREVLQTAIESFKKGKPFFTYIYIDDCMQALLSLNEKTFYSSISRFDEQLGNFINFLRSEGLYYESMLVVTSSRSSSPSNAVPLIIHGPGIKMNLPIKNTMLIDLVPTIAYTSGIPTPYNARGIPIYDACKVSTRDQVYTLTKWVKDLQSDRITTWNRYYETQDELYRTIRQLTAIKEERQSIFNFAGQKEETILVLKSRINKERIVFLGVFAVMLLGYVAEYQLLKKKFLLFK
ncbi:alkaline phosphatase family protein [Syntrophomonas erecta]